jgi:trehalose 6-phosphate synthase
MRRVLSSEIMKPPIRFILAMVVGLALLTWAASGIVHRTTRAWFERDLHLRAELVVNGSRTALLGVWRPHDARALRGLLVELTRDERLMAAEACSKDATTLAVTPNFPTEFSCRKLAGHVHAEPANAASAWQSWHTVAPLPAGSVLVSAMPLADEGKVLGFVTLVHDMSFMERRSREGQFFLLLAFMVLALLAAGVVWVAARLYWRGWSNALRRLLRGESADRPEFNPILRDVRDLYDRILEQEGGVWSPERLRYTLRRHLHGERIVVVANREPYIHVRSEDGSIKVQHPASGLVTAIEPVMRACSGVWIAHGAGSADRETADSRAHLRVPPGDESYTLRRIWLSTEEERGYYYGFANEGLWPLCHLAHARPIFRSSDWNHYRTVNERFADAVCEEVDSKDPIVLVQDYHFALAPRLIRERLPQASVITFWHIPWPNSEHFGICPWREEILEGMLGSSILGFHTQFHCNNFIDSVDRYLESRIDRERNAIVQHGRNTYVRAYPISLEWPVHWLKDMPATSECRAGVREELGLPPDTLLGVGVDRLDYTKGVEERFLAVEHLLDRYPQYRGRFTFVQLAAPSRTKIERYRQLDENIIQVVERINQRFGNGDYKPIILRLAHHEPPTVFRYYRAADVCYVSSLHDGMNLVAKEFVAARDDEGGVLVLSQFTGAARELTEALIVNPYDLDQASAALAAALEMPATEQRDRMRAMRALLADFNVYRWAGRMLVDATRLRQRERLTDRLGETTARHGAEASPETGRDKHLP